MAQLDAVKEELTYLKLWLGAAVVGAMSVTGWLATHFDSAERLLAASASIVLALLVFSCLVLHRRIHTKIEEVRRL